MILGLELSAFSKGHSVYTLALFETKISMWSVGFRRRGILLVFICLVVLGEELVLRECGSPVGCHVQTDGHLLQSTHLDWGLGEGKLCGLKHILNY